MAQLLPFVTLPASNRTSAVANLLLRVAFGTMVLIIHGVHKAEEAFRHSANLAEWPLAREIHEMGVPAPVAQAAFATFVQLIAPVFVIVGLGTRIAAGLLAAVLVGAVGQNLHAARDPQLALLYFFVAVTLTVWGGGRYSVDAALRRRRSGT
jgi:uncharacterized membrane protein YphA (DoxX/SURF4 family)